MRYRTLFFLLLAIAATGTARAADPAARTLHFSGYDWEVRAPQTGGPGPNRWEPRNVYLDEAGNLHLKVTREAGGWLCAEIVSQTKFGFGAYEFETAGRVDRLDRNVILGLFDYPAPDEGADGTNEIDIEFARWGDLKRPNGNFTVYPAYGAPAPYNSHNFAYSLPDGVPGGAATHRFTRAADRVTVETFAGGAASERKLLARWVYAPAETRRIPQKPLAVHINLWLFQGRPPADGKPVEVVIRRFRFTPDTPAAK